ncbi:MAG: isochorismatase family cysteine hydrolase [Thermodesulfobacteriota bacterium]|nr:isochorismatase family cysteine hydrolase [Thermodesulfobacteriota bacterium]
MKPAIIVIDMLKDSVTRDPSSQMAREARNIVPKIQELLGIGRKYGFPIVFACDSFRTDDFIFKGRGKPTAIAGTEGAEIINELRPHRNEIILKKRRLSAFFRTDLDLTLTRLKVDTIVLSGITTQFCVLATAFDGISSDFSVIMVKDCCTCHRADFNDMLMGMYQNTVLYPLLRVMEIHELKEELECGSQSDYSFSGTI